MFNATGFEKVMNGPDQTQGETNSLYASVTENTYSRSMKGVDATGADEEGGFVLDDGYTSDPAPESVPTEGGWDIGGFITNISNLGAGIAQASGNLAADYRVTKQNLTNINKPVSFMDQFNSMPLVEKLAIGVAAFFVLRFALHKMG
jgi:hypothetical protein